MKILTIAACVGMWAGVAGAAVPPAATGYRATVYFAKPEKGGFDIVNGKVLGNLEEKGGPAPVVWTSPTEFFRLAMAGNLIGNQVTVTDGKTVAGLAFDQTKKQGYLLVWRDVKRPAEGFAEPEWAMIRPWDVSGEQIVGYGQAKPDRLPRPAAAFLFEHGVFQDLTPAKAEAAYVRTTDGVHQYGSMGLKRAVDGPGGKRGTTQVRAAMWSSKANDVVDLTPPNHDQGSISCARGDSEVGAVDDHAGVWHGTAASFVDIHPAGLTKSVATATNGTVIAGNGQSPVWAPQLGAGAGFGQHALVWVNGKAQDLHVVLPAGQFRSSEVLRIDARGNILGMANDGKADWTVVWTPAAGDATQAK